ncbi:helix-turn-helix domain-containing protein [Arcobacter sp.]|uniref:helix-turn-helix domain-containing protein n=1 Tax=unclassified Arcobacter TaxID=2593671 RepID=UPI003B00482C
MSILLKRKEYLNKTEEIYPLAVAQKKSMQFNNENFKEVSFYHYRTNFKTSYMFFKSSFKKDIILESKHDSKGVSFIMFNCSSNISSIKERNKKSEFIFKPKHYVIGKIDENFESFNTYLANKQYCTHYILIENEIFDDLIKKDLSKKDVYNINGFSIKEEIPISEKQILILEDLPTLFSLEGKLQELYLESKIIDLIYITINEIKKTYLKENFEFSSKDIKCLYKAKDILIKNISHPPSLKMIAYQSAINEFKLKKGFKKLFGNTVFGFLQELRLNEAKKILMNNEININEVSYMVGYKNVSHFSKIFKEHFGVNPIQIKKNQKKVYI